MEDRQLLRQFVEHNSQEAFAALIQRYLNLVYSVCRRELGDTESAEDVTQAVFLILARKAPQLNRHVVLSGWLFQTARFAAKNARTRKDRRIAYEERAAQMMPATHEGEGTWTEIEPLLNQSFAALKEGDRECVLLRYFQDQSFADVGQALGLSEEAARKRVTRALERMRRFFGKEGVIVPSVALAALLSAHAVKAAPPTCSASVGALTTGVLAGHLNASLVGSHVYQLSEGALHTMKITQIKINTILAATAAAVVLVGFSTYTYAKGKMSAVTAPSKIALLVSTPKPGHILESVPGKTLSAAQIAAHCRLAYSALKSYQGTTTVTAQALDAAGGITQQYHASAVIQFVRPGKIRVEGTDMSKHSYAYVSDGIGTVLKANASSWKQVANADFAIASVTGIAQNAATTIPALLLGSVWGNPIVSGFDPKVREDTIDKQLCYVVTASLVTSKATSASTLWIDEKTFLLRRYVTDNEMSAQTIDIGGKSQSFPASKSHNTESFTNERLNQAIPDSAFALPPSQ
jgi:RNA polymerase sigma factor (sigma-70 family)